MTENDAIAKFKRTSVLWESATNTEMVEAVKVAIQAIEEIQQYRAIGTVEEFKILKEKAKPKEMDRCYCPICRHYFEDTDAYNYCPVCGQKMKSILE